MAEFDLGNPIPWEPIQWSEIRFPSRETFPIQELEQLRVFPTERDPEVMEALRELQRSLGGGRGGGGGRRSTGFSEPFDADDDRQSREPIDALAWYLTFRVKGDQFKWGVYITTRGLIFVGSFMVRRGASPELAYDIARYMLQNHETCHFLVDRAVLTLETNRALTSPGQPPNFWLSYSHRHHPYSDLEEAICNAYAYRMADTASKRYVEAYILRQPHGYCDVDFSRRNAGTAWGSFQQSESQLLSDYQVSVLPHEGQARVIGLNSLMNYTELKSGSKGDLWFTRQGVPKEKLPVYIVR